jgi:spermidine dehydrogenase
MVSLGKFEDRFLGMQEPICRRDFLNSALLASGSLLMSCLTPAQLLAQEGSDWEGYTGEGDYRGAAGNTEEVLRTAHAVRDGKYDAVPSDAVETGETYDCVIVGGGFAGLSAALFFHKQAGTGRTCLVLENHPIFGGVAKRNEFVVDSHRLYAPQASVHFQPPYPGSFLAHVYDAIGLDWNAFKQYQSWRGPSPEIALSRSPYQMLSTMPKSYAFYFGAKFGKQPGMWLVDPWGKNLEGAPLPEQIRQDLLRLHSGHGAQKPWVYQYFGDETSRRLDRITLEDYLMQAHGLSRETVRLWFTPDTAAGHGLGPDALSGFCEYSWSSIPSVDDSPETGWQMFPGGNSGMIRLIVKQLIPDVFEGPATMEAVWKNRVNFEALDGKGQPVRIRLRSTAVRVEHAGEPTKSEFVWVTYVQGGKTYRLKAKSVVMAGGGWITRHVVRDLDASRRDAYVGFYYAPYLVANVAVRSWNFLYKRGISGVRWFEGLGSFTEVRQMAKFGVDSPVAGPDLPTVLTLFVDFAKPGLPAAEQGHKGRMELLSTSFRDYERKIREQMTEMFGPTGFDAKRDIAGIVLNRWGHAFVNPQPGFFFGANGKAAPRDALRNAPFGRIAFSHSDLSGANDHRNAFLESHRAVGQLLDWVVV